MFTWSSPDSLVWSMLFPHWKQVVWAFALDAVLGDPRWLPHPVVGMGKLIAFAERPLLRRARSPHARLLAGMILTAGVAGGTLFLTWKALSTLSSFNPTAGALFSVLVLYTTLAHKSLQDHLHAVAEPLLAGDLPSARRAVSLVVGRDTGEMDAEEVARAAVETLAENTSDGIIAPLFYALLGGAPLALTYKAVNTLDSMVGYRNEKYRYFGTASARLDDLLNYVPARLTAFLMVAAGRILGGDMRGGWRAVLADARKHPSPNAGFPEAAMAGLLGVRLGGTNFYDGLPSERPLIWQGGRPPKAGDLRRALAVARTTSWLALFLGIVAKVVI